MNAQELFIDVSTGRFLDGESTIPSIKPTIYSNEKKSILVSLYKVKNNKISAVTPSPNSKFKARLGTQSLKLSDGIDPTTANPQLFTALATVSTLPPIQAVGQSSIITYSPVTASLEAIVVTFPVVTGTFTAKFNYVSPVTATISVGISTITLPETSFSVISRPSLSDFLPQSGGATVLTFSAILNSPVTATFQATISGGSVTTISILDDGFGYPDGIYGLSFAGGSPASVASALVTATKGEIASINLVGGGSGYSVAPTVTLFCPAKKIIDLVPSNLFSRTGVSSSLFLWGLPADTSTTIPINLNFSAPDNTSTPTNTSVPSAFLTFYSGTSTKTADPSVWQFYWKLNFVSGGYGFSSIPTVTHDPTIFEGASFIYDIAKTATTKSSEGFGFNPRGQGPYQTDKAFVSTSTFPITINNGAIIPKIFSENYTFLYPSFKNCYYGGGFWPGVQEPEYYLAPAFDAPAQQFLDGAIKVLALYPDAEWINQYNLFKPIVNSFTPISNSGTANQSFYAVADPINYKPTRYAICKIEYSEIDTTVQINQYYRRGSVFRSYGGGIFKPSLTWIDYGEGYKQDGFFSLVPVSSLKDGQVYTSSTKRNISIVTNFSIDGKPVFYNTILSKNPTISTAFSGDKVVYNISDGGYGFTSGLFKVQEQVVSGGITTVSITNVPKNYLDGEYDCTVTSSPGGNTGQISISVTSGNFLAFIKDSGFGYTSAPIVTAPAPNKQSGQITDIVVVTRPQGYSIQTKKYLNIQNSPVSGGDAIAYFNIDSNNTTSVVIENSGFGYQSAPIVTAPSPDLAGQNGYIGAINLSNKPIGYAVGQSYDLQVQQSPATGGSCIAKLIKETESKYTINIVNGGFGYTSAPIVTAPSPDAPQGVLNTVGVSTAGRGYEPGSYSCFVSKPPAGGIPAQVDFVVNSDRTSSFEILNYGSGYVAAPIISASTPGGNVLDQITITCAGSYYINNTAKFSILDSSGSGHEFGNPTISAGKILYIPTINGGYGFTDNPKVVFSAPTPPSVLSIPEWSIQNEFNITTASANAILTTANNRDILLEVYETDGTSEQVIVQGTVNLAKRVLE